MSRDVISGCVVRAEIQREQGRADDLTKLRAVAEAARNLVAGARDIDFSHAKVDEAALVQLETALAAAGYDDV